MNAQTNAVRLLLWLLLALPAAVQAQFTYSTGNNQITITGYTGAGGELTIPGTIKGLAVTSIGSSAFVNKHNLTSVVIPNGVTTIGNSAFFGCDNLTQVTIPGSVTGIADLAFYGCNSLTGVVIPDGITAIEQQVFASSSNLTSVTIPNSVTRIGLGAFSQCPSLTGIEIPGSVISIGQLAFSQCPSLTRITIPDGVTTIEGYAFQNCWGLTNVTLGKGIVSIDHAAFIYCTNLSRITIPGGVTNLDSYAFSSCYALTGVYFQGAATGVGSSVFEDDDGAVVYYLPETTGWGATFAGRPTVLFNPQVQTGDASFGVRAGQFGFNVTGTSSLIFVVEAATDLAQPVWSPVSTNTLAGGTAYFSDPQWTNYPARLYRLRMP